MTHINNLQGVFLYQHASMPNLIIIQSTHTVVEDPGMPGGDPDLPETPLDADLLVLIIIAMAFGLWRIRALKTNPQ